MTRSSHLRLLPDPELTRGPEYDEPKQLDLLPPSLPDAFVDCLVIAEPHKMREAAFRDLIESLQASMIIDLRSSPRFNVGGLNRRRSFDLFRASNSRYFDLHVERTPESLPEAAAAIRRRLLAFRQDSPVTQGPLLVFVDGRLSARDVANLFDQAVPLEVGARRWRPLVASLMGGE